MIIPFVKPDITDSEIDAVSDVLRSGWITTGPVTKEFEKELTNYLGTNKVATVNSQTAGAELVLRFFGVGPGDEVIVPAYTYSASCSVVYHCGADAVMVDSQEHSPEMDYDALEAAITEKTKVIIPVDIGGIPCDYERIFEIIERKKSLFTSSSPLQEKLGRILVLADTAHSLGASYKGIMAGNVADFSSFSFHAVKNLTTAEGGAITWRARPDLNDEEVYRDIMLLSLHGQTKDALNKSKSGQWEYDIVAPLYKCNLTDVASAIGLSQLRRYESMLNRRAEIVRKYNASFEKLGLEYMNHFLEDRTSSYHLYLLRLPGKNEHERNKFIVEMDERGITCNVHYKPLPLLSAYKNKGFDIKDYPKAFAYYENLVSLPLYSTLTDDEVDYIMQCVQEIVKA